jgi:hypothetical protein
MASHVYILKDAFHQRFKIGKANNIVARARSFRWKSIDFSSSLGLVVASEEDAYAFEKILHRTFRYARLTTDQVLATGGLSDGGSEWFDMNCWPRLLKYLEDNHDLHSHEIVSGESLALLVTQITQSSELALARANLKAEKEAHRIERLEVQLELRRKQMGEVKKILLSAQPKLFRELEHHRQERQIVGVCNGRYGNSLVLAARQSSEEKRFLWRLELQDTQYHYKHGGGSVITGVRQMSLAGGAICTVSLPRLELQEDGPFADVNQLIHEAFDRELSWLRSLPTVSEEWLDLMLPVFWDDPDEKDESAIEVCILEAIRHAQSIKLPPLAYV